MEKILVITGPTATGKTKLAIALAKEFNGEIVSADSRQVYKGRDVETGKDRSYFQWGLDIVEPGADFSVSNFVKFATKVIKDIQKRGKLPVIVGGTGFYIKALLAPFSTINIPPDEKLRAKNLSLEELQKLVKVKMNPSDWQNPRRLIRAIETQNPKLKTQKYAPYDVLVIGLEAPREVLYQKIVTRRRDRQDLIDKEFSLAKKQLLYQKKYLPAHWFDITDPKFDNKVRWEVKKFVQPQTNKRKSTPTT